MSNFNNKSITNKGLELLSAAMASGKLEFTRIVMGSGTYSGDIGVIESLVSQKQSLDIKSITKKGSQVILSTTLLQSAIIEDFYWKEIGVYAKGADDLEVLYMYGSATDTSFISKDMLNEKMINVGVLVSNAQNVSATIDGSLVYLSRADLEKHNTSEVAHADIRELIKQLQIEIENIDVSEELEAHNTDPTAHDDIRNMVKNIDLSTVNNHTTNVGEGIKTHTTSLSGTITNHVTAVGTNINQHTTGTVGGVSTHVSNERAVIVNAINSARDNVNANVAAKASTGYVVPSTAWKASLPAISHSTNTSASTYKKLGAFYVPKSGTIRVDVIVTRLVGSVATTASNNRINWQIAQLGGGGWSSSTYYKTIAESGKDVDYANLANGTELVTNMTPSQAGFTGTSRMLDYGLATVNVPVTNTIYYSLTAGYYIAYFNLAITGSGSQFNAKVAANIGYTEVN